ncbi:MAG: hypothetical protein GF393_07295, partial [Armatimonadia bacterium]|nr:hypothetical protein [Armatimonadia bacterium]
MIRSTVILLAVASTCGSAAAVGLGVDGTAFTLDGQPAFLLGVSYYAGLGRTPELIERDLDDLRAR